MRRIIRGVDIYSRQLNTRLGLTSPQLLCLREIIATDKSTLSALTHRVNLSASTITGIIDRLESKGFVKRERCSTDRRKVFLCPTLKGIEILSTSPSLLQDNFADSLANLPEEEQQQLADSLAKVVTLMQLNDIPTSPNLLPSPSTEYYKGG